MVLFLKNVFYAEYEIYFGKKIGKIRTLERWETMMKKECFFEKKNFFIF